MASKRLVDVDRTESFGSFFVNDMDTVKQVPKENVLGQFYTKKQVDEMIPEVPAAPDLTVYVRKTDIMPQSNTPANRVLASNGSGGIAWISPESLFDNIDQEVF